MTANKLGMIVSFAVLLWAPGVVRAQVQPGLPGGYNPQLRPTVSPYLNLLRPGNTAVNYYGLVRPQLNAQTIAGQLQQEINTAQRTADAGVIDVSLLATGHRVGFQNHRRFFLNQFAGTPLSSGFGTFGAGLRPGAAGAATGGLGGALSQGSGYGQGAGPGSGQTGRPPTVR
jgi:hypothetical protein